jgi:hypothetical protein
LDGLPIGERGSAVEEAYGEGRNNRDHSENERYERRDGKSERVADAVEIENLKQVIAAGGCSLAITAADMAETRSDDKFAATAFTYLCTRAGIESRFSLAMRQYWTPVLLLDFVRRLLHCGLLPFDLTKATGRPKGRFTQDIENK